MRTVVLAYHEIGAKALEATIRNGMEVVAVFTHRDDPKEGSWFSSVARVAAEHGIRLGKGFVGNVITLG